MQWAGQMMAAQMQAQSQEYRSMACGAKSRLAGSAADPLEK
jgi:hypothetical protein